MIDLVLTSGLGAFWLWFSIVASPLPGLGWVRRLPGQHFFRCPYCFGAWIALALTLLLSWSEDSLGWSTPFAWLAAAAIVGVLGTFIPSDDEVD